MMAALIAGERDPKVLAQLARASMHVKISQLEEAFVGRFSGHHAFLLTKMLARIDAIDADITEVETRIEEQIAPFRCGGGPPGHDPGRRRHRRPGDHRRGAVSYTHL